MGNLEKYEEIITTADQMLGALWDAESPFEVPAHVDDWNRVRDSLIDWIIANMGEGQVPKSI